jgi:hypothetical protein
MTPEERLRQQIRIKYPAITKCRAKLAQLEALWEREYNKWIDGISEERLNEFIQSQPIVNIKIFLKLE